MPVSKIHLQMSRKVIAYEQLADWRMTLLAAQRPLVVTNGCFDLIHPGHLFLLERACTLGATLLVGVTGDEAVRLLKGEGRPAMPQRDRVLILAGLEPVSHVCLFPEIDAMAFLEKARPDIYVKGGDYTIDSINQAERALLERIGATIKILPRFEALSTTSTFQRILARGRPA
jgi:rfaE bifunctional protein nucleotidyltransferase chain/domain